MAAAFGSVLWASVPKHKAIVPLAKNRGPGIWPDVTICPLAWGPMGDVSQTQAAAAIKERNSSPPVAVL
jgi:hypothetical protein